MAYNYDNFDARHYDLGNFDGPKLGSKAPDFELRHPDGTAARLLDFDTEFLVLEMGSLTCPLFQGRRPHMAKLDRTHAKATFAVLYVREAHPGASIGAHTSQTDKQGCAQRLATDEGEHRRILVDDHDGQAHAAYGAYPNSVFIINRHGCVVYFSDWNNPRATGRALAQVTAGQPANVRAYFKPVPPSVSLRVLGQGGHGSKADFLRSFPSLIWNNLIRRNLRLLLGRDGGTPPNVRC